MTRTRRSYADRRVRAEFLRFAGANRRLLGAIIVLTVGFGLLVGVLLDGYLLGLFHGTLATAFCAMVWVLFLVGTGQSAVIMGSWGEGNTRDLLRSARRRRRLYGWIDNIEVKGGDVDHLVLAPRGIVAIDSKLHGAEITRDTVQSDEARAIRTAARARSILRAIKSPELDVIPVVVIWGPRQSRVPDGHVTSDGVHFVAGTDLGKWLAARRASADRFDPTLAQRLLRDLQEFKERVRPT